MNIQAKDYLPPPGEILTPGNLIKAGVKLWFLQLKDDWWDSIRRETRVGNCSHPRGMIGYSDRMQAWECRQCGRYLGRRSFVENSRVIDGEPTIESGAMSKLIEEFGQPEWKP